MYAFRSPGVFLEDLLRDTVLTEVIDRGGPGEGLGDPPPCRPLSLQFLGATGVDVEDSRDGELELVEV